ncbi:MAG TPA: FixH family protein [Terriglobales bacterium]|nr:FixH family protein [Terriglobales bacterium]
MFCRVSVVSELACAAILLTGGCSKPVEPAPSVVIEHEFSPEPPRVGLEAVTFKLADAAARPVTGAHITIEADMSHAGMSPQFAEAKEAESGRYQARLTFEMAGDWVMLLHVTLPSGKKLEQQIDVKGVRPN